MDKHQSQLDITLFNTLKKTKEVFTPIKPGHVSMYHCGPTVYNFIHVGNLRAFIVADLIRRLFEFNGYTVTQIMNITDIGHLQSDADDGEDKMTLALKRQGLPLNLESMQKVALQYYDAFRADLEKVNILPANLYPFASEHVAEDIDFIEKLIEKNHAYKTSDGVYFDTKSIPNYGRLGGVAQNSDDSESRIGEEQVTKSEKKNFRDFAVWKFNDDLGYNASFGKGFPGWHIECSVMSMKYLGETFDIHSGGIDHISVHHNNEIAQGEALTDKLMANYWMHNEHVIMDGGKKMAKSGESFVTLATLEENNISPLGFRYWLLGASYRTPMQFSFEAIQQAEQGFKNLVLKVARLMMEIDYKIPAIDETDSTNEPHSPSVEESLKQFSLIINDDMNTARALAYVYEEVLGSEPLSTKDKIEVIRLADHALGLGLFVEGLRVKKLLTNTEPISIDVTKIADERSEARKNKNWSEADRLRDELAKLGYDVKDTDEGYTLQKRLI